MQVILETDFLPGDKAASKLNPEERYFVTGLYLIEVNEYSCKVHSMNCADERGEIVSFRPNEVDLLEKRIENEDNKTKLNG